MKGALATLNRIALASLPFALVILPPSYAQVHGDEYPVRLQKCRELSNQEQRLQCYDAIETPRAEGSGRDNASKGLKAISPEYTKIDVKTLEEVFCGTNKAVLRSDPFSNNEQKELIDCEPGMKYYLMRRAGTPGYIWGNVIIHKKGKLFKNGWIENTELITKEEWETRQAAIVARENAISLQPRSFQEAIRSKKVVIGMSKEAVELSWGRPNEVHRTVVPGRVHEQWVYGDKTFLYMEDGVLVSLQD